MAKPATAQRMNPADETDLDEVMRRYKEEQAAKGVFKPKTPAVYLLRVLPPREKGLFYRKFGVHYGLQYVSTKFGEVRGVACLKRTLDQDCPLCDLWSKWKFEAYLPGGKVNKDRKDMAYEIRPSERYAMNIIDLNNLGAGVQIWDVPKATYELVMGVFSEEGDITNPATGRAVKATLSQKGDYPIWSAVIASKTGEIPLENWRADRKDLEAYATARLWDYDKLQEIVGPLLSGEEAPRARAAEVEDDVVEPEADPYVQELDTPTVQDDSVVLETKVDIENDPELQKLLAKYQGKRKN